MRALDSSDDHYRGKSVGPRFNFANLLPNRREHVSTSASPVKAIHGLNPVPPTVLRRNSTIAPWICPQGLYVPNSRLAAQKDERKEVPSRRDGERNAHVITREPTYVSRWETYPLIRREDARVWPQGRLIRSVSLSCPLTIVNM